jgi:hypothetical protein
MAILVRDEKHFREPEVALWEVEISFKFPRSRFIRQLDWFLAFLEGGFVLTVATDPSGSNNLI